MRARVRTYCGGCWVWNVWVLYAFKVLVLFLSFFLFWMWGCCWYCIILTGYSPVGPPIRVRIIIINYYYDVVHRSASVSSPRGLSQCRSWADPCCCSNLSDNYLIPLENKWQKAPKIWRLQNKTNKQKIVDRSARKNTRCHAVETTKTTICSQKRPPPPPPPIFFLFFFFFWSRWGGNLEDGIVCAEAVERFRSPLAALRPV